MDRPRWETYGSLSSPYWRNNIVIARQSTTRRRVVPLRQRLWRRQTTVGRKSHFAILTTSRNSRGGDWSRRSSQTDDDLRLREALYKYVINVSFFVASCDRSFDRMTRLIAVDFISSDRKLSSKALAWSSAEVPLNLKETVCILSKVQRSETLLATDKR